MVEQEECRWSGGFFIDKIDSFHVNMRLYWGCLMVCGVFGGGLVRLCQCGGIAEFVTLIKILFVTLRHLLS